MKHHQPLVAELPEEVIQQLGTRQRFGNDAKILGSVQLQKLFEVAVEFVEVNDKPWHAAADVAEQRIERRKIAGTRGH